MNRKIHRHIMMDINHPGNGLAICKCTLAYQNTKTNCVTQGVYDPSRNTLHKFQLNAIQPH